MSELPTDLLRVLRDHSIVVPQDQAVFELVASCIDTPTGTASALTAEEWQHAWAVTVKKLLDLEARLGRAVEALREIESFPISGYHAGAAQKIARAVLAEQEKKQP